MRRRMGWLLSWIAVIAGLLVLPAISACVDKSAAPKEVAAKPAPKSQPSSSSEELSPEIVREILAGRMTKSDGVLPVDAPIDAWKRAASNADREAALERVAEAMAETGLTSDVRFQTMKDGARVKYRLISRSAPEEALESTNRSRVPNLPIGYYYIWTERNGTPTSDTKRRLAIVEASPPPIDIPENPP